ncbi:2Fe-2S iron-sulfur cluster-binding protein [Haloarchaeobius sp. HRN-SO-5]|uniref:2Fe-2S iron-sulfur cluster-binding protein n=1 Tax=Haloarchaeobius sp. HRN-SO-5 TaxID=3446118 RepID=UPI003EBB5E7C
MVVVDLVWRDGRTESVTADDETVLEAAERAGLSLPFGCRTGVCGTCTGRLLAGAVVHEREPRALKARHLADGYVLPCVAVATEDCSVEVGTDVQRDLLTNPWRRRRTDRD